MKAFVTRYAMHLRTGYIIEVEGVIAAYGRLKVGERERARYYGKQEWAPTREDAMLQVEARRDAMIQATMRRASRLQCHVVTFVKP